MLAVIYGDTPRAKILKFLRAPPPIALINSKKPKFLVISCVPGTRKFVPTININNAPNVK